MRRVVLERLIEALKKNAKEDAGQENPSAKTEGQTIAIHGDMHGDIIHTTHVKIVVRL